MENSSDPNLFRHSCSLVGLTPPSSLQYKVQQEKHKNFPRRIARFLNDHDEALDHLEELPYNSGFIHALRPQLGDHVFINRVETGSPWLMQHHGIDVAGPSENTVRICHFSPCDSPDSKITLSSIIAFTYGQIFFVPSKVVIRVSPARFAEACAGKLGFDAKNFNCEHFVNLCTTCESVSDMNHKAFGYL